MSDLTFNEYQARAASTAIYPGRGTIQGLTYTILGLTNEAGEVAGKLKKIMRDSDGQLTDADRKDIQKELGDVLWYQAMVAWELALQLEDSAQGNLDKLNSRKERGVLGGSGDNR